MRLLLKLLCYATAIAGLWWLLPQMAVSFDRATAANSTPDASRAYALFATYLLAGGVLAVFLAWDVAQFLGAQAGRLFWSGGRLPSLTPTWWRSERLRKEGNAAEAIRILRDAYSAHPRQWQLAMRIAEIYQHDLNNPLAAGLEYQSLLASRLPKNARAEILLRLAACHLLRHQTEDALACWQQVMSEFPDTAAARKAARRLARIENPSIPEA